MHYFYKTSPELICNEMQPAFGYYENGELIGLGVGILGAQTATTDRTWLENVPMAIISVSIAYTNHTIQHTLTLML